MPAPRPATGSARHAVAAGAEGLFGTYPGTVAVVTSRLGDRVNAMAAGWHTALSSRPPLYGVAIAPERHTYRLVVGSGRFAVCLLPFAAVEKVAGAGVLSGADGTDKLSRLGLTWYEGPDGLPLPDVAYACFACRVVDRVPTGDHELFVGEVASVHYDPEAFDGRVKSPRRVPAAIYYGRSTYEATGAGELRRVPPELFRDPEAGG